MTKTRWNHDPKTDIRWVDVPSLANTPLSRSTGCSLHDCPGCTNIWALSPFRSTTQVVFRTTPVRAGGMVVDYAISAARLPDTCWCGVPFPREFQQKVTLIQTRANVESALRSALISMNEKPSIIAEIQNLRKKVTQSMLRKLRGERRASAKGVA